MATPGSGLDWPRPGPSDMGSYLVSAIPYVTASSLTVGEIREVSLPSVTRFFIIKNTSAASSSLCVGFTSNSFKAVNSNYFTLSGSQSVNLDFRIKTIFLSNSVGLPSLPFELIAGLTPIHHSDFPVLTASNGDLGIG